jgi:HEPN domain-containing protein
MRRPADWFRQAELDLAAARSSRDASHHEWACFAAQQAAEKAVKALHESHGTEAWGHSVSALLAVVDEVPSGVSDSAKALDKHYIPARYPNTHPAGAPGDLYTADESERALADAEKVIDHVRGRLP